ncbi:MAG: hydrogenase maturation protease [Spirochaetales bacterium]|nr:hydrogenase maturation protease [Spirochaetales bacterium]
MVHKVKIQDQEEKQYLICGLGNPVLTDDAIGILLVRDLIEKCDRELRNLIDFKECQIGFLDVLDDFSGYRHLLIIDSIVTDTEKPGTLILCEPEDFRGLSYRNTAGICGLTFPKLIRLGRMLGSLMPETCTIAGIAVSEHKQCSIGLSPELKNKYPELLYILTKFILKWTNTGEKHIIINHRYKDMDKKYGM